MDKAKINDFWAARTKVSDARIATNYRNDGRLDFDLSLVRRYLTENSHILDLGAGTCTLSENLLGENRKVDAVEKFSGFLEMANNHPALNKIACDIVDFVPSKKYDLILIFGVINFLSIEEERRIYELCLAALGDGGTLIVKNQCGVDFEKVVDGYSEELSATYHARYPAVMSQKSLLSEYFEVEVVDIYPAEMNRWEDTHFYAFICHVP
ncbi:class I SAM-dependent methyltransferase [Agrobacterium pusense]|uniref:class I SAM-dependent methyltransferase n=1 Tax=Agrobacterium pusense TaxID=648995 RepID=UPI003FCF7100|nr:hypothetical protein [Agrobacterium sp. S2]